MPELPEVETVVRDLRGPLVGRRFTDVIVGRKKLRRRWSAKWHSVVVSKTIAAISRRGKWICIDVSGPRLLIHLGMTGQLTVAPSREPRQNHTHLIFPLDDGESELRFRDVRRFGSASVFADEPSLNQFFAANGLGPEPFDLNSVYWRKRLCRARRNLKAILLDQRVVAGVGNIYADEALFEARLYPRLLGTDLSGVQAQRLRRAIVTVLRRAIERRGSSIRDYVGGDGQQGGYQREFRVYGRTGEPCSRCRRPIHRIVLAGRSTHFCPKCQKGA